MKTADIFVTDDDRLRLGWRIAFFVFATIAFGGIASALFDTIVSWLDLVDLAREAQIPLAELSGLAGILVATDATLRFLEGRKSNMWARVGLDRAAFRGRPLLIGLAAGTFAILIPCLVLIGTRRFGIEAQPSQPSWLSVALSALLLLSVAALAEELTVRGYLLTTIAEGAGAPTAVIVTSLIFAALHLFNPGPTVLSTAIVALAGVFLAVVRLSTGSLAAATLAHLAWNLVQAVVLHAPVSGLPLPTPGYRLVDHGPIWLTGGAWGPEGGIAAAFGMLVATFLLVRMKSLAQKPMETTPS